MARNKNNNDNFIVVTDGLPRIGADGENLTPAPAKSSNSPGKSPSTERSRRPSRPSSQRRSDGDFNDTLDPLRALPELRPIPWYTGKELSTEKSTESSRVQTRGACLLASRGNANDPPCNHCKSGVGRFSVCVSLGNWFHGACATCQLATRGNLCSLRTSKDSIKSESEQQESPAAEDSVATRTSKSTPATRRSRKFNADQSQSEPRQSAPKAATRTSIEGLSGSTARPDDEYKSQFGFKRKRESLQGTSVYRPYVSPYAPLDPPNRVSSSLPNTPITGSTPNMIIPANIARDHTAYVNYIRERELQHNGIASQPPRLAPSAGFKAVNGYGSRPPTVVENSRNSYQSKEFDRDRTESMSPSAQLLGRPPPKSPSPNPPINNTIISGEAPTRMTTRGSQKRAATNGSAAQPNSSKALDPPDAPSPLIDALPRRKQKQIYGIISGLQSGIWGCQQQAESMQKQLDLLQAALGIDAEEGKDVSMVG